MFAWRSPRPLPFIVAHRGASGSAPENTLAAFSRAIAAGAHALELDVRLTADRKVVVFHDNTLTRTTNGRGRVSSTSSSVIRKLSAGAWFSGDEADAFAHEFADERVPFLEEALELAAGRVGVNVELKFDSRREDPGPLVRRACGIIKEWSRGPDGTGAANTILVSSFHHKALELQRAVAPSIDTAVLVYPPGVPATSGVRFARRIGAAYLVYSGGNIRRSFVQKAHAAGILTMEYTVNTRMRLRRSVRYGVDGVITNEPASIGAELAKLSRAGR